MALAPPYETDFMYALLESGHVTTKPLSNKIN
jgi:hypothetical protein